VASPGRRTHPAIDPALGRALIDFRLFAALVRELDGAACT
jgi:hypothetical protein